MPSSERAWRAFDPSTWISSKASRQADGARSIPSDETIRPSLKGYSAAWRRLTNRGSRAKAGIVKPATIFTVSWAKARPSASAARCSWSSATRGARLQPPTRTLTGWIGRPPRIVTSWLPAFFMRSACSTSGRWSAAMSIALG